MQGLEDTLEQRFSIHFKACTPFGKEKLFSHPLAIFIKKEYKQRIQ